jgi:hypothetical protein
MLRKKPEATGIQANQPCEGSWLLLRKVLGIAIHNAVLDRCTRGFSIDLNAVEVAGHVVTSVAGAAT